MSTSYADATAAWQPQAPAELPQPDKALLEGVDAAGSGGLKTTASGAVEYTPPLTPPSEKDEPIERAAGSSKQEKEVGQQKGGEQDEGMRQRKKKADAPGEGFVQSLPGDVTEDRPVPEDLAEKIARPWVARANIAASVEKPYGTTDGGYAEKHKDKPVLKQHVIFWDKDQDNIIWPLDTWRGFRELGYSFFWCTFAMSVIHFFFSWFTAPGVLPDPFFRIFLKNGHRSKHGSDTGVIDPEGRFIPAKFEEIFSKFDKGNKGGLTFIEGVKMIHGLRQAADPIGWAAECFEWGSTYLLIWPKDGVCDKESIRTIYDGSLFFVVAAAEREHRAARKLARQRMTLPQLLWDSIPGVWHGWSKENKAANFEFSADKF